MTTTRRSKATTAQQPTTLLARVIEQETTRHNGRLAEIKKMEAKLRMFEPDFAELEARKAFVSLDGLRCTDDTLYISGGGLSEWDIRRYDTLLDIGFVEIDRSSGTHFNTRRLKKGRLTVSIMIPASHPAPVAQLEQAEPAAASMAAGETDQKITIINKTGTALHIAAEPTTVGDMFVTVPETTLPNGTVVPTFQVGRYLCTKGDDGRATVNATGKPWVRVSYHDARKACIDAGFKLITELQALAIAWNISQQDNNWTGGKVGEGKLHQGIRLGNVSEAQPGTYLPENFNEQRYHKLSNGEVIYDFAGNAFTWVFDDVQGDEQGLIAKPFADDSPSITTAPYPSLEKGMGWRPDAGRDWSGRALLRGGCWGSGDTAGVFYLNGDWPGRGDGYVGFRCTK